MLTKYNEVVNVLHKPPESRNDFEVNSLIPWFRKRSKLLESLKTNILVDVIKNLSFISCDADKVLIKEGDRGDCMYILLRGTVGVYRLPEDFKASVGGGGEGGAGSEEQGTPSADRSANAAAKKESVRQQLGERVTTIGENCSFGDVALMSDDCVRTASVLTEEPSDLIVFDRDLYDRSVKCVLKKEFDDKANFIANSRYFRSWHNRYKKQLTMALTKQTIAYEGTLTKQGSSVDAIYFILSGEVKVSMDPNLHRIQYHKLMSQSNGDSGRANSASHGVNGESIHRLRNMESMTKDESHSPVKVRAKSAHARQNQSTVEAYLLGINECIGDIEVMMDLKTYLQNAVCSQRTEILHLEIRHFDRLVHRRHQRTLDMMKEDLVVRLGCRLSTRLTGAIPLLSLLIDRAEAFAVQRRRQTEARRSMSAAAAPVKRVRPTRTLSEVYGGFVPSHGALVDLYGPGTVFHRIRQRDERRLARLGAAAAGLLHRQRQMRGMTTTTTMRLERPVSVAVAARERRGIRRDIRWTHLNDGRPEERLASSESDGEGDNDDDRTLEKIDAAAINPALKELEERVRDWAMNRTNAGQDSRRMKPRVTELYQSETENIIRQIATNALYKQSADDAAKSSGKKTGMEKDRMGKEVSRGGSCDASPFSFLQKSITMDVIDDGNRRSKSAARNGRSTSHGFWAVGANKY